MSGLLIWVAFAPRQHELCLQERSQQEEDTNFQEGTMRQKEEEGKERTKPGGEETGEEEEEWRPGSGGEEAHTSVPLQRESPADGQ